jgi:prepilin-type N-terminal cleavage/methylation domain-containing protein
MIHTLTKRGFKGFTLIELLVVIAIIGLLSTIIAAPIQNARKKARDSKKIAEIKAVQLALDQFAEANAGQYPYGLAYLAPTYMPILPSFGSTTILTVADRDKFAYAPYTSGGAGLLANNRFAYHMGVHLENFSQGLDNDRDCLGADRSSTYVVTAGTSTCAFFPSTVADVGGLYIASTTPAANNYQAGMLVTQSYTGNIGGGTVNDFDGSDGDISRCDATMDCIFDVNAQQ